MVLHGIILALDLSGICFALSAIINMRSVSDLVRSRGLKRAWRALMAVIGCCAALQLTSLVLHGLKPLDGDALVNAVINVLGPAFAATVTWLSRRTAQEMLRVAALEEAAFLDPLTGLANRRRFDRQLEHGLHRTHALGAALSLIVLDVDHFKRVNDTHGHSVGDLVLKRVAALLAAKTRNQDTVCRVGGEEFTVIMPGIEGHALAAAAERLRRAVAETGVPFDGDGEVRVTVSLGVATLRPDDTADLLFRRADAALYAAKRGGRDRVSLAA